MKKFFTLVVLALLAVGCAKEYDDSGLRELIAGLDLRVSELEANVSALQSALGDGKFVRKVEEYKNPETGRTTGVTVTYTDGNVVHFNIVPSDPTQGPVFSVIRNGAGELVWAVDGQAVKVDGEEVPVYQTPIFSIDEEGNLWVEVDGKKTNLGPVKSEGATLQDGIFTNLAVTDSAVVLTLSDGSTVNIPFAEAFKLNIETTEFTFGEPAPIEIPYTVSAKTEGTVVGVAGYSPKEFKVAVEADKIVVTPLSKKAAAVMMAYADSKVGLVSVVNLTVEAEGFEITDTPYSAEYDYVAEGEDAVVVANAVSNIAFDVKPVEAWIHVASVKSQAYAITLKLDDNKTGEVREGTVNIVKAGTEEVVQTIRIAQLASEVVDGPKDLSKKESANSYIVVEPGDYKFKAVKGNSAEAVAAASAEILWETWNNGEEVTANSVVSSVKLEDGYIFFTVPGPTKPGNAVIAAKDAGGVILWSWHIWVPATTIVTNTYGLLDKPMMDRNLGALVAATDAEAAPVESFGLTYQWGRKDPYPGPKAVNTSSNATVAGKALEVAAAQITLEESIANPTLMGHKDNEDWLSTPDNTLWNNEAKSIYDPCPPGYRVPACNTEQPMWNSDLSAVAGWAVDAGNYWFKMGNPAAVFPFAGYRDDYGVGSMTHAYDRAVIWSAQNENDVKGKMLNVRGSSTHALGSAPKARAGSVRCVAIDENAPVPPVVPEYDPYVNLSKDASANSYIVDKAGDYKFKAVKGNSSEAVAAASAEVLWETWNNGEEVTANSVVASVEVKDGFVLFSTPETLKPGNAVIAAKDAAGVILWSWHIWVPATAIETGTYGLLDKALMDRNLGALVAATEADGAPVESFGLTYQWGRKDPYPGPKSVNTSSNATVAGKALEVAAAQITLEESIANPTLMGHKDNEDWLSTPDNTLWSNEAKTMYDPCPPGYRVPACNTEQPMWSSDLSTVAGWGVAADKYVFKMGDPAAVFPFAGYRDDYGVGSMTHAYDRSVIWSAQNENDVKGKMLNVRGSSTHALGSAPKARAGSVRCVAE